MTPLRSSALARPARPDDVPAILAMIQELADYERMPDHVIATEARLDAALFGPQPAVFAHVVELAHGDVAGFALWFLTFSTWLGRHGIWLEDLYVRRPHRRRGYGRLLLVELARICEERGYARLEWWVLDWNEPAIAFYRTVGAVPQDDWTLHRVSGDALERLATAARINQ